MSLYDHTAIRQDGSPTLRIPVTPRTKKLYDLELNEIECTSDCWIVRVKEGVLPAGVTGLQLDDNHWLWVDQPWTPKK